MTIFRLTKEIFDFFSEKKKKDASEKNTFNVLFSNSVSAFVAGQYNVSIFPHAYGCGVYDANGKPTKVNVFFFCFVFLLIFYFFFLL